VMMVCMMLLMLLNKSSGTLCDMCGSSSTYSETIVTTTTPKTRHITSTGCPNHYSVCTGKSGLAGCGSKGVEGTATQAVVQSKSIQIPSEPIFATNRTSLTCQLGPIGIALNGVSLYSAAVDQACTQLDVNSDTNAGNEWISFDYCGGHSQEQGDYHYHFPPSCLLKQIPSFSDGHSPQLGWALDGFPVYGPKGPNGVQMITCAKDSTRANCLDECEGLEMELPSVDKFRYRYYIIGNTSDLNTLPSYPKPTTNYVPCLFPCYRGCTIQALQSGACTSNGTNGFTSSYTATANTGVTTKYVSPNAINKLCQSSNSSSSSTGTSAANSNKFVSTSLSFIILAIIVMLLVVAI